MKLYYIILSILWISSAYPLCSQSSNNELKDLKFKHLSLEEGLSQSSVLSILQDKNGFLWFGTRDGLNRYDGCNFKIYRHISNDSTSLSNSYIKSIYEDKNGTLWIGTQNGLNKYLRQEDSFKRYIHKENSGGNYNNEIWGIIEGNENQLWIGLNSGLHNFDIGLEKLIHPLEANKDFEINAPIRSMLKDSKDNLWIKTTVNITVFNIKSGLIKKYDHFPNSIDELALDNVSSLYEDRDNNIWIGYKNGLAKLNRKKDIFEAYTAENSNAITIKDDVRSIQEDYLGNLWIGTYNGIYILNADRSKIEHFQHDENDRNSLSQNSIYKIFEDSKGDLWIGTYAGGINYFDRSYDSFRLFLSGSNNALNYKVVSSIIEDEQANLWIGTEGGGINFYNKSTGDFKFYTHNKDKPNSLSSNNVKALLKDSDGDLWIGTHEGGLNYLNPDKSPYKFKRYTYDLKDTTTISNNRVISLCEDVNYNIWIGTENGLNIINKQTKIISRLKNVTPVIGEIICTITPSSNDDQLYIGGNRGLLKIDVNTKKITPIRYELNSDDIFSKNSTLCIYEDELENVWIGTEGGGLYYYEKETGTSTKFGISNGLLSEVVYSILPDNDGHIWLSTNYGLSKLNLRTYQIKNYDVSDGIQGNEFNYGARLKSKNGDLLFGGTNGLTLFTPGNIVENSFVPPVLITDIQINNEPYQGENKQKITLKHDQNVFGFNFIALSFSKANKNQYAYKLEGFDNEWNYVGDRKSTIYTNIDPGKYTFKVKASNSDGLWNEKGTKIDVEIRPAPWRTWWAYLAYLLVAMGAAYLIRKQSLTRINEKNELKKEREEKERIEEVNALKLQLFTNISHDFRTPLTLIVGPLQKMIQEGKGDEDIQQQHGLMHRNAMVLLQLVNQLLDFRKSESGQLKLQATKNNIVSFIKDISLSFEEFAKEKRIDFNFSASNEEIQVWFDKIKLKKIIYNLLSNAFKHTEPDGDISIRISEVKKMQNAKESNFVLFEVTDTGKGISKENIKFIFERFYQLGQGQNSLLSTGIGLSVTKSLVDLHNGIIEVNSNEDKGSSFRVYFPMGKKHLNKENRIKNKSLTADLTNDYIDPQFLLEGVSQKEELNGQNSETKKSQPTLLIVDDNVEVRSFVKNIFIEKYNILEAENGEIGVQTAKKQQVDIVISDVMMPVMDGIELCKSLKTNISTSHIPILLLTSKTSKEARDSGYFTGADDYMAKPFDPHMLFVRINNLVQSRRNLMDKFRKDLIIEPKEIAASSSDELFLEKAFKVVENNLTNHDFSVVAFTAELHMSKSVLYRKIKALTGQSTSEFIRTIRIKRAGQLIVSRTDKNISEIAYELGFNDLKYFRKSFKSLFNESPSQYRKNNASSQKVL